MFKIILHEEFDGEDRYIYQVWEGDGLKQAIDHHWDIVNRQTATTPTIIRIGLNVESLIEAVSEDSRLKIRKGADVILQLSTTSNVEKGTRVFHQEATILYVAEPPLTPYVPKTELGKRLRELALAAKSENSSAEHVLGLAGQIGQKYDDQFADSLDDARWLFNRDALLKFVAATDVYFHPSDQEQAS